MTIDELGRAIRTAREKLGISQAGAGDRAGLGGHVLYNIEKGRQFPCWERLVALCGALGIDVTQFTEMYAGKDFGERVMLSRTEFMDNKGAPPPAGRGMRKTAAEKTAEYLATVPEAEEVKEVKPVKKSALPKSSKNAKNAAKKQRVIKPQPAPAPIRSMPRTIVQTVTPDSDLIIHVGGYRITINKI